MKMVHSCHVALLLTAHVLLLPSLNAVIFDCQTSGDGDHPHPSNCSKFIRCNGLDQNEYDCVPGMHFSESERRCEPQESAACNTQSQDNGSTFGTAPLLPNSTDIHGVFLSLEQDTASIGSDVWILCEVSGEPFVGWYAIKAVDEKIETGRRRVETSDNITYYLVIESIQRGDEGVYTCRGVSQERNFTLHVEDNHMTTSSESADSSAQILSDVEYIYKGSRVSVECLVTGDKFEGWYTPKGNRVGGKGRIRLETAGEGDFHLVIDQVTADDEGTYTCRSTQGNATYQLHVLDESDPWTDQGISGNSTDTYSVFLPMEQDWASSGSELWITCEVSGERFDGWYAIKAVDEKIGQKGRRRVETSDNITYYLVIQNVQRGDEGVYTCRGASQEKNFTLYVEDGNSSSSWPNNTDTYSVFLPMEQDWASVGSEVWITCEVSGEPFVGWYAIKAVDEKIGQKGRRQVETSDNITYYLVIQNVQRGDEGVYTCRGASQEKNFTLHVEDGSSSSSLPNSTDIQSVFLPLEQDTASIGSDVWILCEVSFEPFVGWYAIKAVNEKIVTGRRRVETSDNITYYLVIENIQHGDEGVYTCRSVSHERNFTLHVEEDQVAHETSDPNTQIPTSEEHLYEGSYVSAECLVTGDKFDGWYTPKGDRVGDKGRIRMETFGEGDFHLLIDQVTADDEGNYTCRCAQSNATYQLHVLDLPSVVPDIDPRLNTTDNTEPPSEFERATTKPAATTQEPSTSIELAWLPVRLAGGLHPREGRVEVWYNGTWGTVCDSGWDINEATVICRMLRYPRALSATRKSYYTITQGKIWLDGVICSGNENSLLECQHETWGKVSCNSANQAGVRCGGNRFDNVNQVEP